MNAPGLGESQQAILDLLKRRGNATIPQLAEVLDLNIETVRDHLKTLARHDLVCRQGSRKSGPGRPEIIYGLSVGAEQLFPRREGEILHDLAAYMVETGHEGILKEFFNRSIGGRRQEALARVARLKGKARLKEVARILTELGFMAVVEQAAGATHLRLCHCPLRDLIGATRIPCRAELGFVSELLGERLTRESYIPSGDPCCSYRSQ